VSLAETRIAPKQGRGAAWRLADKLRQQIIDGEYSPGDRLPSYRELMDEYDLTSGTVSYAMAILAQQGCVERRHGSGVFVEGKSEAVPSQKKATSSGLFALVVPDIESGIYLSLQAGMEDTSQKKQEQLITATTQWDVARQADVLFQLMDRGVSGVALVPPVEPTYAHQLRMLQQAGVPLVLLHRGVPGVRAPLIEVPFKEVGLFAGTEIALQGHRKVAAFMATTSSVGDIYHSGLQQGLQENGAELAEEHVYWGGEKTLFTSEEYLRYGEAIERDLTRMLDSPNRPTAVFASFDRIAEMVYQAAMRVGVRVPEDLSIVCFGSKHRIGAILPRLSTVVIDERETGRKAYKLLASMRDGDCPRDSNETYTMPLTFDKAKTLGPPPVLSAKPKPVPEGSTECDRGRIS